MGGIFHHRQRRVSGTLQILSKNDAIKGLTFTTDVKHLKGGRLERPDHIPIDIFLNEIPFYRCDTIELGHDRTSFKVK